MVKVTPCESEAPALKATQLPPGRLGHLFSELKQVQEKPSDPEAPHVAGHAEGPQEAVPAQTTVCPAQSRHPTHT